MEPDSMQNDSAVSIRVVATPDRLNRGSTARCFISAIFAGSAGWLSGEVGAEETGLIDLGVLRFVIVNLKSSK